MDLASKDMVTWLGSRQDSPTPDPDAIKLLQFLDTAALGIKMALEKSSNPKGKRLPKDNARGCSRRRLLGERVSSAKMSRPTGDKHRKLKTRHNARESFNSLFNIEPLVKPTKHKNVANMMLGKNSTSTFPEKSLLNRDLPVSFFVEPALRGRRQMSTDRNSGSRFVHSSCQNSSTISSFSEGSHDSSSRSPSLPEDTLESILDQGEINDLLSDHMWHHDLGSCSVKSVGSWLAGADLTCAATPSPRTCSESSRDSFFSTATPMTPEWIQGADLTPSAYSADPCPNTLTNFSPFQNRMSPFQFYGYQYGHGNNSNDTVLLSRNQTHCEWDARSNNRGTNAIHTSPYFNVRIAPTPPREMPQCFSLQCRGKHFSTESSLCISPKASIDNWSREYNQPLSWSSNS